jgi:F-type H+-transporting ATPase subunit delta
MSRAPTPKRYAQAAFQIAKEQGLLDKWLEDLQAVQVQIQDDTTLAFLSLPRPPLYRKIEFIRQALANVDQMTQNLVGLLTSRQTVEMVPEIVQEYSRLLDTHYGRIPGQVTTAIPLDNEQKKKVGEHLKEIAGMTVVLTTNVDPKIVGGLVARFGDKVIDGSTRAALDSLKHSIVQESPA